MEYVVLGLLIFKSQTIYELNANFESGLAMIYAASYGNLQYAVKKLIKNNWISFVEMVDNGRNKKVYKINEFGREAFLIWMHKDVSENKLETQFLAKTYFMGLLETKEEKIRIVTDVREKVKKTIEGMEEMDRSIRQIPLDESSKQIANYQFATLSYGIHSHKAALEFIINLEADIKKGII